MKLSASMNSFVISRTNDAHDNFLLVGTGVNTVDTYGEKYNKTYNWTKSYNADTGILTVSAYVGYGGHKSYGQYNIYVVFGDINTK